jgi:hypothetical protein
MIGPDCVLGTRGVFCSWVMPHTQYLPYVRICLNRRPIMGVTHLQTKTWAMGLIQSEAIPLCRIFTTKTVRMHAPASLVGFFFRAVQYIVQYGMRLRRRRRRRFCYVCGYVSRLLYHLWHTVNGAEKAWGSTRREDNKGENSNLFAIAV